MILKHILTALVLISSLPATAQLTPGVEKSWENGVAAIPNHFFNKSPPNVILEKKHPVVILMHGCTGITQEERSWASHITKLGYIVVMPDSFARPGRVSNCNAIDKKSSWAFPMADKYRQEEIAYTLERLQSVSWADSQNIFLMGHSEGGRASALAAHSGFKGKIISGWTCTHIFGDWHGINGSKDTPMLAVAYLNDPWRGGAMNQARCIDQAVEIRSFTQVDLDGWGHATSWDNKAKEAVRNFLVKNLN